MRSIKILLIDGDVDFGMVLKNYLQLNGYNVTFTNTLKKNLFLGKSEFDLLVTDCKIITQDKLEFINSIRKYNYDFPVIFLSEEALLEDIFEINKIPYVDYCFKKPFSTEVLIKKIQSIIKLREISFTSQYSTVEYTIGDFTFNYGTRQLTFKGDEPRKLTPKESKLLKYLSEYKNTIMPKAIALTKIWRDDNYFTARSMDVYITKLRKYLMLDENIAIVNVRGEGYKLLDNTAQSA
ncbi:response regulator transcription factor [uncultured Tenacibaculum sp.]|uniref:response regulator transcription factor n=1 Tax=uncultured Tenacibaculum sp. TaxID=174713 RepID=UPI00262E25EE|nr:response regulator transcription factor [uncultured Tenacibaculum sp.]